MRGCWCEGAGRVGVERCADGTVSSWHRRLMKRVKSSCRSMKWPGFEATDYGISGPPTPTPDTQLCRSCGHCTPAARQATASFCCHHACMQCMWCFIPRTVQALSSSWDALRAALASAAIAGFSSGSRLPRALSRCLTASAVGARASRLHVIGQVHGFGTGVVPGVACSMRAADAASPGHSRHVGLQAPELVDVRHLADLLAAAQQPRRGQCRACVVHGARGAGGLGRRACLRQRRCPT